MLWEQLPVGFNYKTDWYKEKNQQKLLAFYTYFLIEIVCFDDVEEENMTFIMCPQEIASLAEWCYCRVAF